MRQEDLEFKASLGWVLYNDTQSHQTPPQKKKKKKKKKKNWIFEQAKTGSFSKFWIQPHNVFFPN
jgi:hypothetical protein